MNKVYKYLLIYALMLVATVLGPVVGAIGMAAGMGILVGDIANGIRRLTGRGDCVMALGNLGDGAVSKVSRAARDELSRKYPLGRDVSLKEFLSSSRSREGREALDRGIRI